MFSLKHIKMEFASTVVATSKDDEKQGFKNLVLNCKLYGFYIFSYDFCVKSELRSFWVKSKVKTSLHNLTPYKISKII
jgi:hypothetical protein